MASVPPCFEPRGSKVEDFGLETESTSATRRNQMKFRLVLPPEALVPLETEIFPRRRTSPVSRAVIHNVISNCV